MNYTTYNDSELIKHVLKATGMNQTELSEELGYSRQYLYKILKEKGSLSTQGRKHIELFARYKGIPGDNALRDISDIENAISEIEKHDFEKLGSDHSTVLQTLQWVINKSEYLPMDKLSKS